MFRATEDVASLQQTIPTGADGIEGVLGFWESSTVEVKNLLKKECDIIYECRYCRNLFRSLINFVSHKRTYCRGFHEAISSSKAAAALDFAQRALNLPNNTSNGSSNNGGDARKQDQPPKKVKGLLKRTNIVGAVNKRLEHYALALPGSDKTLDLHTLPRISRAIPTTTFEDGQQVIETMPQSLATKESLPSGRVALVIPQDYSSRYREMNLRRRGDNSKSDAAREVGPEEIAVMERMGKYGATPVDFGSMICLHNDCREKRPFSSLFTLAYHVTVKHNFRLHSNRMIPCFICDKLFNEYKMAMFHMRKEHDEYYTEHFVSRTTNSEEKGEAKRGRKSKSSKTPNLIPRPRSLSPEINDFLESDESMEEQSDDEFDKMPLLKRVTDAFCRDSNDSNVEKSDDGNELSDSNSISKLGDETDTLPYLRDADSRSSLLEQENAPHLEIEAAVNDLGAETEWEVENCVRKLVATVVESETLMEKVNGIHVEEKNERKTPTKSIEAKVKAKMEGGEGRGEVRREEESKGAVELKRKKLEDRRIQKGSTPTKKIKKEDVAPEIAAIESHERRGPHKFFYVHWVGKSERTWISEARLKKSPNAVKIIENFMKTITQKEKGAKKAPTKSADASKTAVRGKVGTGKSITIKKIQKKKKRGKPVWLFVNRAKKMEKPPKKARNEGEEVENEDEDEEGANEKARSKSSNSSRESSAQTKMNKADEEEQDDDSAHSDEDQMGGSGSGSKLRPSRHRRKPNWISEINFVTGFRKKRQRHSAGEDGTNEIVIESFHRGKQVKVEPEDIQESKEVDEPMRLPPSPMPQLTPLESPRKGTSAPPETAATHSRSSRGSSQEQKSKDGSSTASTGTRKYRKSRQSRSPSGNSTLQCPSGDQLAVSDSDIVLPSRSSSSLLKSPISRSSSGLRSEQRINDHRLQYTPRARKQKFGEEACMEICEDHEEASPSTSTTNAPHSRRKQNLSKLKENDDVTIVRLPNGRPPPRPEDLSEIPVYLTEVQRDLFFSFIRPASPCSDGEHKCMQCGKILDNMMEGRRHAVGHLRVMRLRCSLCNCGSFFCSDMRTHLQQRHCEMLHLAPKGYVLPGDVVPCMTQKQADELTKLVDPLKPGRVMFTSGKIVSVSNPTPYYPDPEIEKRVLGDARPAILEAAGLPETSKETQETTSS